MGLVSPPALKVKPDSNGTGRRTVVRLPKVPQRSSSRGLWHPEPTRASRPRQGHSPANAQVTGKRFVRPRRRRRRRRHDVTGRCCGARVARHRRPGSRRCWGGGVCSAVGSGSCDLLWGHEPRGRRRAHEVSPAATCPARRRPARG